MKPNLPDVFGLLMLLAGLELTLAGRGEAQTFTTLHTFTDASTVFAKNRDGAWPCDGLVISGNTLYGTAQSGGTNGAGTIFKLSTDGTGFTVLHTAADGNGPVGGLIVSGNTLYGTAFGGNDDRNPGVQYFGTVFSLGTDGSGFTTLHRFAFADGRPDAALVQLGDSVYGTGSTLGQTDINIPYGTVYKVNVNNGGFTVIHSFFQPDLSASTNSDGINPIAKLVLSGNTLYGTANLMGAFGHGTVFKVNIDGSAFATLHSFNGIDGSAPQEGLMLSGKTLYGTTLYGGYLGYGTVFKLDTDGTGFTNIYNFTNGLDGAKPNCVLVSSGNTLYGTAALGGSGSGGTMFQINNDGTQFKVLYSFGQSSDGQWPIGNLLLTNNTLYGTTYGTGPGGFGNIANAAWGTVYRLELVPIDKTPPLAISISDANVIVTWPTNDPGFTLLSATNVVQPAVWRTNASEPLVLNGRNVVTNLISARQVFYRLIR